MIEQARERHGVGVSQITEIVLVSVAPGSVTTALEPLRMARKLDPYRETARMALEPWLVEAVRVLSSKPVVHSAESIARKILDTYLEPDKTFVELRDMANNGTIDVLREFSATCREELEDMEARQL